MKAIIFRILLSLIIINIQIVFSQKKSKESMKTVLRNNVYFFTEETGPYSLNIEVTKLKNDEGNLMIGLFDENKNKIAAINKIPIIDSECILKIDSLNSGKYVVQFWHDINNNGILDMGIFGQPKESYGNSNNIKGFMGPPKYESMIFEIKGDLSIKMRPIN